MRSQMYAYKRWNDSEIYGFHMKSFIYVFNEREENDNWTLYGWLFT